MILQLSLFIFIFISIFCEFVLASGINFGIGNIGDVYHFAYDPYNQTFIIPSATKNQLFIYEIANKNLYQIVGKDGISGNTTDTNGADALLNFPTSISLVYNKKHNNYPYGYLVSDHNNHCIRFVKSQYPHFVSTSAGICGKSGKLNGIGKNVLFNNPMTIASDIDNLRFAVSDYSNGCIRLLTLYGYDYSQNVNVTTIAGICGNSGTIGTSGSALDMQLSNPVGVVFIPKSNSMLISEYQSRRILRLIGITTLNIGGYLSVINYIWENSYLSNWFVVPPYDRSSIIKVYLTVGGTLTNNIFTASFTYKTIENITSNQTITYTQLLCSGNNTNARHTINMDNSSFIQSYFNDPLESMERLEGQSECFGQEYPKNLLVPALYSNTKTLSKTISLSKTNTTTITNGPSKTNTWTRTNTITATITKGPTKTNTRTFTKIGTKTGTKTRTKTKAGTKTRTKTETKSGTKTGTKPGTKTWTKTRTNTIIATLTNSPTKSNARTLTKTNTETKTVSMSKTLSLLDFLSNTRSSSLVKTLYKSKTVTFSNITNESIVENVTFFGNTTTPTDITVPTNITASDNITMSSNDTIPSVTLYSTNLPQNTSIAITIIKTRTKTVDIIYYEDSNIKFGLAATPEIGEVGSGIATITSFAAAPLVSNMVRVRALNRLMSNNCKRNISEKPNLSESPIQMEIPDDSPYKYLIGLIIGNIVVIFVLIFCYTILCLGIYMYKIKKNNERKIYGKFFKEYYVFDVSMVLFAGLMTPVFSSSVILLDNITSDNSELKGGLFGLTIIIIILFVSMIYYYVSNKSNISEYKENKNEKILDKLLNNEGEWKITNEKDYSEDKLGIEYSSIAITSNYKKKSRFVFYDFVMIFMLAIPEIVAYFSEDVESCELYAYILTAVLGLYLLLLIIFTPLQPAILLYTAILCTGVQFIICVIRLTTKSEDIITNLSYVLIITLYLPIATPIILVVYNYYNDYFSKKSYNGINDIQPNDTPLLNIPNDNKVSIEIVQQNNTTINQAIDDEL